MGCLKIGGKVFISNKLGEKYLFQTNSDDTIAVQKNHQVGEYM